MSSGIILRVENVSTFVKGRMESSVYAEFKKALGYYPEDSYWMIKQIDDTAPDWKKNWDGLITTVCWSKAHCRCNVKKEGLHFPTGLCGKAIQFLKDNDIAVRIVDARESYSRQHNYTMSDRFEQRDYQCSINDCVAGLNGQKKVDRGIIQVATGGGKTGIQASIIQTLGVSPSIVYVPSVDLLKQVKEEIEMFVREDGSPIEVGMVGGGVRDIKDVTVMTIQTAVRALGGVWVKCDDEDKNKDDTDVSDCKEDVRNLIRSAKLILADECQHWSAETCQIISDNSISARFRFFLSATPFRDKNDDILIEACSGKVIANVSASDLIRKGYLVKPTIYFSKISNMRGIGLSSYPAIYKKAIVENEERNRQIVDLAIKFKENGRKVLILIKQVAHGKMLEKLIPESVFIYGDTSKKKRAKHLDWMRTGEPSITISSVIFDEGINCRPLDALILAGAGESVTRALQRIGRIIRTYDNKDDAIVVDFMDCCKYLQAHSKKRISVYRKEEEFEILGDCNI